jgi:hypothetical protein
MMSHTSSPVDARCGHMATKVPSGMRTGPKEPRRFALETPYEMLVVGGVFDISETE